MMERVLYRIHRSTAIAAIRSTTPFTRRLFSYFLIFISSIYTYGFVTFHLRYSSANRFHWYNKLPCIQTQIQHFLTTSDHQCLSDKQGNTRKENIDNNYMGFAGLYRINLFVNSFADNNNSMIQYRYSPSKGVLNLDRNSIKLYDIPERVINITCYENMFVSPSIMDMFLESWNYGIMSTPGFKSMKETLFYTLIGFDKIVLNSIINQFNGTGYAEVPSLHIHDLNYASEFQISVNGLEKNFVFKIGVVITTIFLFFVISSLINFTISETQERMLKFTRIVRSNIRNRRSYVQVVLSQTLHSLVFVAIIVGMLFFLFEVYGEDHLLSFIILCVVWFNEIFSVTSVRTYATTKYFPPIFFLHFSLFHIYFFSFPFGFHLEALWSCICWNLFWCYYFWNFFELPYVIENIDEEEESAAEAWEALGHESDDDDDDPLARMLHEAMLQTQIFS